MLGQSLSAKKWLALFVLTAGVACVQIPSSTTTTTQLHEGNYSLGIVAVAVACICSGFAGVYFERVLKGGQNTTIWVRNIQLSVGCLAIALFGAFVWDGQAIRTNGFFQGYNPVVVFTICVQAAGGLIVAMVIKYADNILKGFATSLSIILSTVASIFLFNFVPTVYFLFGSILVFLATYLYSMPDKPTVIEAVSPSSDPEKGPILVVDDYDADSSIINQQVKKPFRDESDHESLDDDSRDSSIYEPDDGHKSRNFSPSLIQHASMEKQGYSELDHVG